MVLIFIKNKTKEFDRTSNEIIGAAIKVHKTLGPGFLESIYHNALIIELERRDIPFETEKVATINYKEKVVGEHGLDLVVKNDVVVELIAVQDISDAHFSQIISYLKASSIKVGLIINFSKSKIDIKRAVLDYDD
jgi:GxxExxY protein